MSTNMPATVLTDEQAKQHIAANVSRLMRERGMTQSQLADATDESNARISLMIRGIKLPSAAFLHRIAEALETSVDELLENPKKVSANSR